MAHAMKTSPLQRDVTAVTPYDGVCIVWRSQPADYRHTVELCLCWSKLMGLGLELWLRSAFQ